MRGQLTRVQEEVNEVLGLDACVRSHDESHLEVEKLFTTQTVRKLMFL